MGEWIEYELGELLSYEQPTPFIVESTDYDDSYPIPVLTAGKSFLLGYTNEKKGIYDTLPVIIFDDFTTASQYVNFKFKVKSSAMKILTANKKLVLPKFIFYRMQIIDFDASTHKRYWIQHYSKIKVAIPSLSEQERIVAKIEELFSQLDDGVNTLEKLQRQIDTYRQSVLKNALSGNCLEIKPICHKKIFEFAEVGTGATPLTTNKAYYGGNIPWVTSGKINDGKIFVPSEYITETAIWETNCKIYPIHTLLVAMYGEGKTRGKCAELMIPAATNQALAAIVVPANSIVTRDFLKLFLTYNYEEIRRKAVGGVQPNLNLSIIKNLVVPVYTVEQQENIVAEVELKLSVLDSLKANISSVLHQAEALRQSILKKHLMEK